MSDMRGHLLLTATANYVIAKLSGVLRLSTRCFRTLLFEANGQPETYDAGGESVSNLVEWAFSGNFDAEQPILLDAVEPTRSISKKKAMDLVTRLAGAFKPGSTVCLHLNNDVLYPVLVLSILAAGCQWTGTNTSCTRSELEYHLRISKSKYIITSEDHLQTVNEVLHHMDEDIELIIFSDILDEAKETEKLYSAGLTLHDLLRVTPSIPLSIRYQSLSLGTPATLMLTSGTTGRPKMAQRTHGALLAESSSDELIDSEKDYSIRRLFCTPIFHAYSFPKMIINPLRQGQPTYLMKRFDDSFAEKILQFRITDIIAVPPILARLADHATKNEARNQLQSLRTVISAGAPLTPELKRRFTGLFDAPLQLIQEWGMTECGCISRVRPSDNDTSESVGQPVGKYSVRVSSESQMQLSDGSVAGELFVRGPQLMTGYLDNEAATATSLTNDGWYKTGDVGRIDDRGRIFLVDRTKDIIKVNGWQVSPVELEETVLSLPGVSDAAALSRGYGMNEHPQMFVVRSDEQVTEKMIKEELRSALSRYKVATCAVTFVDSIPRAPSGKVLRRILRAQMKEEVNEHIP